MATTTPQALPHDTYHHGNPNTSDPGYISREQGGYGPRPNSYIANTSIVPTEFHVRNGNNTAQSSIDAPTPVHPSRFHEELMSRRGSSMVDGPTADETPRAESQMSTSTTQPLLPSRAGTLKKKPSLSKKGSLRRGGGRKSSRAGSVRSVNLGEKEKYAVTDDDVSNSAFYIPVPTSGAPTEILATRFQAWRRVLKDLIAVFRDIQRSYETRSKMLLSASNAMNNISMPPTFLISGGIADATSILKDYHRRALQESNKAKEVEAEIIMQLIGLRNDLQQKTKEIKGLSGDFKNSVEKEVEATRKSVRHLHESLGLVDSDAAATSGKGDPFIIKTGVDRQVEKQLEEENYLHRAYLNLEKSGRELESIVVGEIQKAYNAYASILKRDADAAYDAIDRLRDGPISMPKDHEWNAFVTQSDQLIDPDIPVRNVESITYPGKDHPAAAEVRSGMLERKSKYLKSYTPGWYVLSPTHLHEFKSADRIASQALVMSLYLPEQKLGSHSQPESSSHKFILKGRQTGSMHRGHAWVFRAESHDTMLAWYEDIKNLTEKTGEARNAFVKSHSRSLSGASYRASIDSERALEEDEADATPYTADHRLMSSHRSEPPAGDGHWQRGQPGGRFPSEVQLDRQHVHAPNSPSSGKSTDDRNTAQSHAHVSALGAPYEGQMPNQRASMGDGPIRETDWASERPAGGQRDHSNYEEWMAPLPSSPHRRSTVNDNVPPNSTPPPGDRQSHSHSIGSSTGAPVIVPDDRTNRTIDTGPRSNAHDTDVNSAGRMTMSPSDEGSHVRSNAPPQTWSGVDGPATEYSPEEPTQASHKPSTSSRGSTGSELKVPGQFPVTPNA